MSQPIEFLVVRSLQTALQGIRRGVGDYHFTVAASAVKLDPNQAAEDLLAPDGPRPFVLLELLDEEWDHSGSDQQLNLVLPVRIHWVSDSRLQSAGLGTPTDDSDMLETFYKGCADVETAILKDVTRGGVATSTHIVRRTLDTTVEGLQVWAAIDVRVRISRTAGLPNAA